MLVFVSWIVGKEILRDMYSKFMLFFFCGSSSGLQIFFSFFIRIFFNWAKVKKILKKYCFMLEIEKIDYE